MRRLPACPVPLISAALLGLLALATPLAFAQVTPVATAAKPAQTASAPAQTSIHKKWSELTPEQKTALQPLEAQWPSVGAERQKKWLEVSKNYATMTPAQQQALHERMSEWVKLSPNERAQARLNFAQTREATKTLTPEEKKAKWEAYQALSDEEKRKLAKSQPVPKGAALPTLPVSQQRLTTLPSTATQTTATGQRAPRIASSPEQLNTNTLLPKVKDPAPKQ